VEHLFRFPLKQHIGAQAAPTIVEGDKIVRGQLLALKGEKDLGANIYSSVSGIVAEVKEDEIVIRAEEEQTADYVKLTAEEPLDLIREAGIVGLGGAGFPTYAKLQKPFSHEGVVIVNAAECEPILGHNIFAIEKKTIPVDPGGMQIAMEVTNAKKGMIAIKGDSLQKRLRNYSRPIEDARISIALLPKSVPDGRGTGHHKRNPWRSSGSGKSSNGSKCNCT